MPTLYKTMSIWNIDGMSIPDGIEIIRNFADDAVKKYPECEATFDMDEDTIGIRLHKPKDKYAIAEESRLARKKELDRLIQIEEHEKTLLAEKFTTLLDIITQDQTSSGNTATFGTLTVTTNQPDTEIKDIRDGWSMIRKNDGTIHLNGITLEKLLETC